MVIKELIENGGNAILMVSALDLKEFAKAMVNEYRQSSSYEDEKYFTREEFAERKGVSLATLWRWERAGILKGTRRGSRVFYRDSDLIEK